MGNAGGGRPSAARNRIEETKDERHKTQPISCLSHTRASVVEAFLSLFFFLGNNVVVVVVVVVVVGGGGGGGGGADSIVRRRRTTRKVAAGNEIGATPVHQSGAPDSFRFVSIVEESHSFGRTTTATTTATTTRATTKKKRTRNAKRTFHNDAVLLFSRL